MTHNALYAIIYRKLGENMTTEKEYLTLLKKVVQSKRAICGFNENQYGEAIVTTGVSVQYKPEETAYEKKHTTSYEDYIFEQTQQEYVRKRR